MKNEAASALGKLSVKKAPHVHSKERMKRLSALGHAAKKKKKESEGSTNTPFDEKSFLSRLTKRGQENADKY